MAWIIYLALVAAYAGSVRALWRLARGARTDVGRGARLLGLPRPQRAELGVAGARARR